MDLTIYDWMISGDVSLGRGGGTVPHVAYLRESYIKEHDSLPGII